MEISGRKKLIPLTCSVLFFNKMADLGIEKSIFIKPSTFHLTVLMLKLWNKDRINAARDVLKVISFLKRLCSFFMNLSVFAY